MLAVQLWLVPFLKRRTEGTWFGHLCPLCSVGENALQGRYVKRGRCCWVSSSRRFEASLCLYLMTQAASSTP